MKKYVMIENPPINPPIISRRLTKIQYKSYRRNDRIWCINAYHTLNKYDFRMADLWGKRFVKNKFVDCDFSGAELKHCSFVDCEFENCTW
ncbi:MAG: pentapeptide repeat-containing protein [Promethearchaeota archaeon]